MRQKERFMNCQGVIVVDEQLDDILLGLVDSLVSLCGHVHCQDILRQNRQGKTIFYSKLFLNFFVRKITFFRSNFKFLLRVKKSWSLHCF